MVAGIVELLQATVMLAGQERIGAKLSVLVMVWAQVDVLLQPSEAVQVRVIMLSHIVPDFTSVYSIVIED